jgi:hypothetical protein
MIKIEIVQGEVEFTDVQTSRKMLARNNMEISDSSNYHYRFTSHDKSRANILIHGKCLNLEPNSEINITNIEARVKSNPSCQGARLLIGKIWYKLLKLAGTQDKEWEKETHSPNAVSGVRG